MLEGLVVEIGQKDGYLIESGGKWLSKGMGPQRYHVCWNQAQRVLVLQPECWKRNLTTVETRIRMG